jgi:F-type H+-transporting ATPase subunit c
MTPEILKIIVAGMTIAIGTIAPAVAIGQIGTKGVDAISRNPEAEAAIRTAMILSIAFAEAIAIYVLVVALVVKFT